MFLISDLFSVILTIGQGQKAFGLSVCVCVCLCVSVCVSVCVCVSDSKMEVIHLLHDRYASSRFNPTGP